MREAVNCLDAEENSLSGGKWKLHATMCKQLSSVVSKVETLFTVLEAARPTNKSGIQALCSLSLALEKSKRLLDLCSDCSKFYLALTGESILTKFEKAKSSLLESLYNVKGSVSLSTCDQITIIISELEQSVFNMEESERQVGDELIRFLRKERTSIGSYLSEDELEVFREAALKLRITSSRMVLAERRALRRLIEKARADEDKKKESVVSYLLLLLTKYSKLLKKEAADDTDSQGSSAPCSPTVVNVQEDANGFQQSYESRFSKINSFNLRQSKILSGSMPIPPEELRCPISLQLMFDPVVIASGQTYERVCIEKWFHNGHTTCPKTQQQLLHLSLTPNYSVKGLIASWCEQNGIPIPSGPLESPDLSSLTLALPDSEAADTTSFESNKSSLNNEKFIPIQETHQENELKAANDSNLEDESCQESEMSESARYKNWQSMLSGGATIAEKQKVVEQIRFHLKDDGDARLYMGANGYAELLIQYLRIAISEGDQSAQEAGALALFNFAVNNNINKGMLLSAGVVSLLEEMILNLGTFEPATALFLNLSCFADAKPIICSSRAVPFLVQCLQDQSSKSSICRLDALYTLFNLSSHPPNIPILLSLDIVSILHPLLSSGSTWADKALAIFVNLALDPAGRRKIISTPGLISLFTDLLDTGEPIDQEQAASCLWILCSSDESCCNVVLQEGAIPALVLLSANGTPRAREKAQKLLKLFRDQRQREMAPGTVQFDGIMQQAEGMVQLHIEQDTGTSNKQFEHMPDEKNTKARSTRFGKALTCLLKGTYILRTHRRQD